MAKPLIKPLNNRQKDGQRANIQVAKIIGRLEKIGNGEIDGTAVQVKALNILLDKALPSLSSVDSTVTTVDQKSGSELRAEAIQDLIKSGLTQENAEAIADGKQITLVPKTAA